MPVLVYIAALAAGLTAARLAPAPARRPVPRATLAVAAAVAAMFALQLAIPSLLPLLARDPALLSQAQPWRAVSALFVQDGGWPGAVFNLACLLLVGTAAERRWGTSRWLVVYFAGGVATEFLGLAWQPHGAGNSIACFALAGALTTSCSGGRLRAVEALVRGAGLLAGVLLISGRDIHGLGYAIGALLGVLFTLRERRPGLAAEASDAAAAGPP